MSSTDRRRLRAPTDDGGALIDPPLGEVSALLRDNQAKAAQWDQLSGVAFSAWRDQAHRELIRFCKGQARGYHPLDGVAGQLPPRVRLRDRPVIMSGHQPTLFHPGVWFKNFLLSTICRQVDGAGINLVIDNDLSSPSSIQVPSGDSHSPSLTSVSLDGGVDQEPWEERAIADRNFFLSFRERVLSSFAQLQPQTDSLLLNSLWEKVVAQLDQFEREHGTDVWFGPFRRLLPLGKVLAQARHEVELEIGLRKYELELSSFTHWNPFRTFAGHLISRAAEFRAIHNAALQEYRLINHIRSRTHPVPELEADGPWVEVPLWIWTSTNRRRRRAFVRPVGAGWELSDRMGASVGPWWVDGNPPAEALEAPRLVHIRPKALITTIYARLVLSDLFIHGIGGAKYDELTDLIIRRFFGIQPPAYLTATATFRLPIERPEVSLADVQASARRLRELRYRPESFLNDLLVRRDPLLQEKLGALAAEKSDYLAAHDLRRCPPNVFKRLDQLNRSMHEWLAPVEREHRARHDELVLQQKHSQMLGSREFSFVLFPSEILPARLLDLCKVLT